MKRIFKLLVISAVLLTLFGLAVNALSKTGEKPEEMSYSYFKESESAESVEISGRPNVRSEPIVFDDYRSPFSTTTSYGRMSESLTIPVSKIVRERKDEWLHEPLDYVNGYFIGILVSDIEQIDGWEKMFPEEITKDPDGIVWINCDYISVD